MTAIYFDESGFTGKALLDPAQPLFCVASSTIGEEEARALLDRVFPDFGGAEFKFQQLWRREKTRKQLVTFAQEIGALRARCNPATWRTAGVQTERRLRGEPAAGSDSDRSWAEDARRALRAEP